MTVGSRSLLFGVHQVFLHPWFVAYSWWKLYGFPWDPRLWVAFFVHDLGYWGKPNMDGLEGEQHPRVGAHLMGWFDVLDELAWFHEPRDHWYRFALLHSRFFAKRMNLPPSRLCYADKMAIVVTPWWIYLPLARLSGELDEYMTRGRNPRGKYAEEGQTSTSPREWHRQMQDFVSGWIQRETAS